VRLGRDLIWGVAARTPKEAYDIQNQLFSDFSDVVMSYNVYTFVNNWWFPKKYLLGSAGEEGAGWQFKMPEVALGTVPEQYTLDSIEAGLIALLSENARLSTAELAEGLDTTAAIVKYRLERLERTGVVAGYRVDVDRSLLGMTLFNVQVQPRSFGVEKEQEFHNYCRPHGQTRSLSPYSALFV
jgi:hypothetical protein